MCFQAEIETVAKVTHEKGKRNDTQENKYGLKCLKVITLWLIVQCGGFITLFSQICVSVCSAIRDHSSFKMYFLWKMKILMI